MYTHVQRVSMTLQASIMQIHMHERRMQKYTVSYTREKTYGLAICRGIRYLR